MKFPETAREGTSGHNDAIRRLYAARQDERYRTDVHRTAQGTEYERDAANDLAAAGAQVSAREAWVTWVERGC